MGTLRAKELLVKAAFAYKKKRTHIPKDKIQKKLDEIKYLSSQKNVPKLTLRKEINSLESQLKEIMGLEAMLLKQGTSETKKVSSLKKENDRLKKKLAGCEDKDLQRRVAKLSHLLAEVLAKKGVEEDVNLSKKILEELHLKAPKREVAVKIDSKQKLIEKLQSRIILIRHQFESSPNLTEEKAQELGQKIILLESKLGSLKQGSVRHTMIFEPKLPKKVDKELENELPLPPAPKIEVGV